MKSTFIWLGVLAGSVGLGVGMYTVVVAPGTSGMTVSGTTASPEPRPTVVRYKTEVVKDPPKRKVVEVPVAAASSGQSGAVSSGGASAAWTQSNRTDDERDEAIGYSEPESEGREESDESAQEQREEAAEAAEEQREEAADAAEEQQEEAAEAAQERQESAGDESDEREDEDDD